MHRILFVVSLALVATLGGCSSDDSPFEPEPGVILNVSLLEALQRGYEVSRVEAEVAPVGTRRTAMRAGSLAAGATVVTLNVAADGRSAAGDLGHLAAGDYVIAVSVYTGVPLLARGEQSHTQREGPPGSLTFTSIDWDGLFPDLPRRILFIGNSLSHYNGGLDEHIVPLAGAADANLVVTASLVSRGGFSLEDHWLDPLGEARDAIATGAYDVVVLQGSPSTMINNPDSYDQYAALFVDAVVATGMRAALLVPPSYRDFPQYATTLREVCQGVADATSAGLIPVNRAWYRVEDERPNIELFDADGSHPSVYGTYLYLCVIYASLYQRSAFGADYVIAPEITNTERNYLQKAAWRVTSAFMGWPANR
jgi:hypothetical protein